MISRYGIHDGLRLDGLTLLLFPSFHMTGKDSRQDRSRYLMDGGSDSSRNGDSRGKEYRY